MSLVRCVRSGWGWALVVLIFSQAAWSQSVKVTALPRFGEAGSLRGVAGDLDFAAHRAAAYAYVEGSGWSSLPPVELDRQGAFAIDAGSGQAKAATIFTVLVLPKTSEPSKAVRASQVPAQPAVARTISDRYPRTIQFAGYEWAVKDSSEPVGPGGNRFSARESDVWVDEQGRLHLAITRRDEQWWSTEVFLMKSLGFGTYSFTTNSRLDTLDANATFGAFTWDSHGDGEIAAWPFREIDVEDSRWGNAADTATSQFVVQPYSVAGNLRRYKLPPLGDSAQVARSFAWLPGRVDFWAARPVAPPGKSPDAAIDRFTYRHDPAEEHLVPEPGRETFRFNLWLNKPLPAADGRIELIVEDFKFTAPSEDELQAARRALPRLTLPPAPVVQPEKADADAAAAIERALRLVDDLQPKPEEAEFKLLLRKIRREVLRAVIATPDR